MPSATPTMTIRKAEPGEREALEALQRRASLMWEEHRDALLAHPDAIDLPADQIAAGHVFVCEHHGEVAGFGVVLPREDGQAELDGLFVEPAAWGRGVGRRLIGEAERLAMSRVATTLHVIANARALGFYTACGFELDGQAQTRFGVACTMKRRLGMTP